MKHAMVMMAAATAAVLSFGADFSCNLQGEAKKPWTNLDFPDESEFHFAILPDRTGGERPGVFGKAIDMVNLLRPEFTICVGDLIAGARYEEEARKQSAELADFISRLKMPFFHVVGNHDIITGFNGTTEGRDNTMKVWKDLHGTNTYYSFIYKNCQFICFDTMEKHDTWPPHEVLSENQIAWALGELETHKDVRWRFLFMHKPIDWTSDRWLDFERKINKYDYTVFCGDWHNFCTAKRLGKKYYMLGTVGGTWDCGVVQEDLRYGIMDAIAWVTVTKTGPVVSYIRVSGVFGDTVQTCATTRGWIETPLDLPSHRAEDPAKYAKETNTALIPKDPERGDGYDWHFRHALILRWGRCLPVGYERIPKGKTKRVVLLGDETASAESAAFGDEWFVVDMGFRGDRIENVLWRVVEGALLGYEPDKVIISVGRHNRGVNTEAEIRAGLDKLESYVRAAVPKAEVCRSSGKAF